MPLKLSKWSRKGYKWPTNTWEKYIISLVIKKMQIKITMRYCLSLLRIAVNAGEVVVGKTNTLHSIVN
jgi:hypothetical protein